jgi:GST-like protein
MALTLYHGEPNGPSLTVLATLFEKGAEATLHKIDLTAGERHTLPFANETEVAMSVEGEGPVLVADGVAITDGFFAALYLEEAFPGTPLRPEGAFGHWQLLTWCRWMNERMAPAAALLGTRAYLAPKFAGKVPDLPTIASTDLAERWRAVVDNVFAEAQLKDSHAKVAQAVQKIETALADNEWLLGPFTIADIDTYAWIASMELLATAAFVGAPRTIGWLRRVKSRPSVQRALALGSVDEPLQVWAPGPEINRWG